MQTSDAFAEFKKQMYRMVISEVENAVAEKDANDFFGHVENAEVDLKAMDEAGSNNGKTEKVVAAMNDCEEYITHFLSTRRTTSIAARIAHMPAYCTGCSSVYAAAQKFFSRVIPALIQQSPSTMPPTSAKKLLTR